MVVELLLWELLSELITMSGVTEKYIGVKTISNIFEYNILQYVFIRLFKVLQ